MKTLLDATSFEGHKAGALFTGGGLFAREVVQAELPRLQTFYNANPEYFFTINGKGPPPDLARVEFDERPPPHLPFAERWLAGLWEVEYPDTLVGVTEWVTDFVVPGVWHLGLLIVATRLHGRGAAEGIYRAFEQRARDEGAQYLRLGVVEGNARAERFWQRRGFEQVRVRQNVDTGGRFNTVRVMVKPIAGVGIDSYLEAVPRDQPGSPLP